MLTSKQRAQLRAIANGIETILYIGKGGIGENVVMQADTALTARELIKGRVLENCGLSAREALSALCEAVKAEPVQAIGTRFVMYRENPENKKIFLVKDNG